MNFISFQTNAAVYCLL